MSASLPRQFPLRDPDYMSEEALIVAGEADAVSASHATIDSEGKWNDLTQNKKVSLEHWQISILHFSDLIRIS